MTLQQARVAVAKAAPNLDRLAESIRQSLAVEGIHVTKEEVLACRPKNS